MTGVEPVFASSTARPSVLHRPRLAILNVSLRSGGPSPLTSPFDDVTTLVRAVAEPKCTLAGLTVVALNLALDSSATGMLPDADMLIVCGPPLRIWIFGSRQSFTVSGFPAVSLITSWRLLFV